MANIESAGISAPVAVSHSLTVLSPLDSTRPRSDENATENTATECPIVHDLYLRRILCAQGSKSASNTTSVTRRTCRRRNYGRFPSPGTKSGPHTLMRRALAITEKSR